MKKYLLSALLITALSISARAQFTLGIKGGTNFSQVNTDNLNSSTVTGYQLGAFARIGSSWYLQPELYYSSTGGNFNSNDNFYTARVRFNNLNIPLLLGKRFGGNSLNFRLMAGPIYTSVLSKNFSESVNNAYNDFGHYNNGTLGYQAGAGVDIGPITADVRYEGNLTKINPDYGQRQSLIALSLGFKIL